ncbi:MAG: DUF3817 domain-containing protein [Mycobacteriaceae bacterium]
MTTASPETAQTLTLTPRVASALTRYRILAYTTGVLLIDLTVSVILKYTSGDHGATAVIGVAHGWIYVVYLLLSLDLAVKARFRPLSTVLVLLAGTIPLMSFVAEHKVTIKVRAGERL